MKKLALITVSLLISMVTFAQVLQDVPQKISYSGVVTEKVDEKHELVKNTTVDFKVVIRHGSTDVYSENHIGVKTNGKGQVVFEIGKGGSQNPAFNTIGWHKLNNPIIDVKISEAKGLFASGYVTIRTVPYAFYSQVSRYISDEDGNLWKIGTDGKFVRVDGTPVTPTVETYSISFDKSTELNDLKNVPANGGDFQLTPTVKETTTTTPVSVPTSEISKVVTVTSNNPAVATVELVDGIYKVTVSENTSATDRTATLTFTTKNGTSVAVVVNQAKKKNDLDPNPQEGMESKNGNLNPNHPFARLAVYNVKAGGKAFVNKHDNSENNGYFTLGEASGAVPEGYILPTKDEFLSFMPEYSKGHPEYSSGNHVYKTIAGVHFRYTYKAFDNNGGSYLEIRAFQGGTKDAAKAKLDANDDEVAARYFPTPGYKENASASVDYAGYRGYYWSSSWNSSGYPWLLLFDSYAASVISSRSHHRFPVRPLRKL